MKRNSAYVHRRINDLDMLVPVRKNRNGLSVIQLNEFGIYLWEHCTDYQDIEGLCVSACDRFNVKNQEKKQEVKSFIEAMVEMEFIIIGHI